MNKIFSVVITVLTAGALYSMANDVFAWAVSGKDPTTSASFAERAVDMALQLPIKILQAAVNIVMGVIEALLRAVFSLVGLSSAIDFDPIVL